ncbi:RidA family protein [Microbacterium sp. TPD7012]|uniref:RidA family protein n=1 Tax=Microbacterium sp. TPD7012 TaxID=2171975 RepID=UPI000D511429|nr:RidA family protein [Microbacterium sp. TPD7012]PVE96921.1 reactive intermediate/imine deaminase [Microbacterium sp. TPD7012]
MNKITSTEAPAPGGPYSQAVVAGDLAFLAGQGPFDAQGQRVGDSFADQVRATFQNLETVAQAAGSTLHNAVRLGAYLRSLDDFPVFNEIAREYLSEPFPARTTIEVALRGFDIELDAVVVVVANN